MQSGTHKSSSSATTGAASGARVAKGAAATVSGPTPAAKGAGKQNGSQVAGPKSAAPADQSGARNAAPDQRQAFDPLTLLARRVARLISIVTTVGMFLVLGMGTLVTNTGSQFGCGNDWPLCKGKFIPAFTLATAIEFSHRAVVGVESLLVLAMAVSIFAYYCVRLNISVLSDAKAALTRLLTPWSSALKIVLSPFLGAFALALALGRAYRRMRLELQILLPLMIVFLMAQAALGALAVMYPESPEVLALHFGVSLLSFVTILLPTLFILDENGWDKLRDRRIPAGFRWLTWGLLAFTYIVVYLGAYVRHTGDELGCLDWPLCNGKILPTTHAETIVFLHRIAAALLTAGVVWLLAWAWRMRAARPDLYWGSLLALIFVAAQAFDGPFVVYSRLDIFSTLLHSAFVALLFGALSYLTVHVVRRPKAARAQTTKRIAAGTRRAGRSASRALA